MGKEAESVVENIFADIWNIDMRSNIDLRNEKLLGSRINMTARDLLVLLFMIEEELDIHIKNESIVNGKFDTFNHIVELICYI